MPKVSIIVPVYNVEKYLSKCLQSLISQTLDDYEIIVVNDGSPDQSQAIIENFALEFPKKIKAFKKKNGGLSDARNFGISKAKGDFIGFVDSDDFVEPAMFEKMYKKAINDRCDIVVCAHSTVELDQNSNIKTSYIQYIKNAHKFGKSIYEEPDILAFSRSYAWNKLYKRDILSNYQFPKGQYYEDSAIVYNILSSAEKIGVLNEPLYYYVIGRSGAITSSVDYRVFDIFKSCISIIEHYRKIGKFENLKEQIESVCLMHISARFCSFRKKGSLKLKLKYVDYAFDFLNQHFEDWQKNKYYLKRRAEKLAVYPIFPFEKARETRKGLKKYFILLFIKNLPLKIFKKIKRRILKSKTVKHNAQKSLTFDELRELQIITLNILKTVVEFCNKNHIRYYLFEGSLLGAVRHGGFIPWDDDLDIAMPRNDYEKFIKIWDSNIYNECKLFNTNTYKKYYLTFSKVVFTGKCRFTSLVRKNLKVMNNVKGPSIDIFPLDNTDYLNYTLFKRVSKIKKYRNVLLTKAGYIKDRKKKRIYLPLAFFVGYKTLQNKLHSLYTADSKKTTEYVANFASSYNINKEIFKKDWFEPAREVKFEDITVTIPNKSEKILSQIYGDYKTLPNESLQVCPHQYIVSKD